MKKDILRKFNSLGKLSKKQYVMIGSGIVLVGALAIGGYMLSNNSPKDGFQVNKEGETIFVQEGEKLVGWNKIDGDTLYFDENGVSVTGWQEIEGSKYYFDVSGVMKTGLYTIEDKIYYFNEDGTLFTGTKNIGDTEYSFDENGVLVLEEGSTASLENNEDGSKSLVITDKNNEVLKQEVPKELTPISGSEATKGEVKVEQIEKPSASNSINNTVVSNTSNSSNTTVNKQSTNGSSSNTSSSNTSSNTGSSSNSGSNSNISKPSTDGNSNSNNGGTTVTPPVVEETKPSTPQVVEETKPVAPPVVEEAPAPVTPPVVVEEPKPVEPAYVFPMSANDIFNYAMSISGNYTSQKGLIRDTNMNINNSGWDMPMQFVKTDSMWTTDKIKSSINEYWSASMVMCYFEGDCWNIQVIDTGDMIELYMFY